MARIVVVVWLMARIALHGAYSSSFRSSLREERRNEEGNPQGKVCAKPAREAKEASMGKEGSKPSHGHARIVITNSTADALTSARRAKRNGGTTTQGFDQHMNGGQFQTSGKGISKEQRQMAEPPKEASKAKARPMVPGAMGGRAGPDREDQKRCREVAPWIYPN